MSQNIPTTTKAGGRRRTELHGGALECHDRARELFRINRWLLRLRAAQTNLLIWRATGRSPARTHVHEITGLRVDQADVGRAWVYTLDALELFAEAQVALLIAALGQTRTEHANSPWLSTSHARVYTAVVYTCIPSQRFVNTGSHDLESYLTGDEQDGYTCYQFGFS